MISVGVIGCGHWGPNHIRIFSQSADSRVLMCADLDEKRLSSIKALFPEILVTKDYKDILNSPAIDAVVVAVPTNFHFQITREALQAGKHLQALHRRFQCLHKAVGQSSWSWRC